MVESDILIVGIIVAVCLIFLVILFILWLKEKSKFKEKRKDLIESSKQVEESSVM